MPTLACGPFFELSDAGVYASIFVLLVVKPLTHFAFIQAFRFRVTAPDPMTVKGAARIAAVRTLVGAALILLAFWILSGLQAGAVASWSTLMAERTLVWLAIGWRMARLRGRRLAGWTISGAGIDAAYDAAIGASLIAGWLPHVVAAGAIALFIAALTAIGRRWSLRSRFTDGRACLHCGYDLAGNVSGICPECGAATARRAA